MKKLLLLLSFVFAIFIRIDSFYAAGSCGINMLDPSVAGTTYGYTRLNGNAGTRESNYGLTVGSGAWAMEFPYGTVWGMANCNTTSASSQNAVASITPENSGQYCWCQATGFTASGNSYTSGPQCTTSTSNTWTFVRDLSDVNDCADRCAYFCLAGVRLDSTFRSVVFNPYPFSVTTSATNEFSFNLSPQGTFYVDCGTGGTLSGTGVSGGTITKNNTTKYTYKCSYPDSAIRTIRFGGTATNYDTTTDSMTISFVAGSNMTEQHANPAKITAISGNLSTIFPYISGNATNGAQPRFNSTFYKAINLQSVPNTLFSGYTTGSTKMFRQTFWGCTSLQTIPSDLFAGITTGADYMFDSTFYGCTGLQTIPSFKDITTGAYYMFRQTFYGCTGLQTIPSDSFAGITTGAESMFAQTFSGCTGLQTIPSDLFKNITTGASNMFAQTFSGCTGLQTIPSDLFKNITTGASSMFDSTFYGCTGLQIIPSGLFANITTGESGMFSRTFEECIGLTSIPSGLFSNITTGVSGAFRRTFYNCTNLTGYIPPTLFAGLITNNAATNTFNRTFTNTGMAESCPSGTEYATQYTSGWGGKVSCTDSPSYSVVSYSCGSGIGNAPSLVTAMPDASFTPAANTCRAPAGYNGFSGWLVSGTNDIKPAGTAFTWNYSGDKTLTAQYTGNTINMTFDGETSTPAMCSFGSAFVPPTPEPRPGYIFTGWKIKTVHVEKCGIDGLTTGTDGTDLAYSTFSSATGYNGSSYGLTVGSGQWAAEFSYGTVWGMANCNNTNGTNSVAGTTTFASNGQYCWCQATGFTASGNSYTSGPQCSVDVSGSWVFYSDVGNASQCSSSCASNCVIQVLTNATFRTAVFNAVGQ